MKKLWLLFLLLLAAPAVSFSQGLVSDGRDFYVGMLYPSYNTQPINFNGRNVLGFYGVYVLISSYSANQVTVGYFNPQTGVEDTKQVYTVGARVAIQVPLDLSRTKPTEPGEIVEYKSCHITAKHPINVQYFSTGSCSGGSYLGLPTNMLGKTYVVESYHDNVGGIGGVLSNEDAAGYFEVIAAFDGTHVNITPTSTTRGKHSGVNCGTGATGTPQPFQISLNHGQTYMVKSAANDPSCNISGTTIVADKPVAVIAGHENAFTDGSDPQPGGSRQLEARDYMIEEMIPVEYWDTTGLVSIPFVDSQAPVYAGFGDEYDFFTGVIPETFGPGPQASEVAFDTCGGHSNGFTVGPFQNPVQARIGITSPVNASSTNGTKIHMVQYDQRMQGGGAPYPAPSQMSIVPMSLWKYSYLWSVPANTFEILQGYYINLICNVSDWDAQKIKVSVNGGKLAPINSALATKKKYTCIPGHPELVGVAMALGPGSYYATCDTGAHPFMIYNYGFRAIDPDRDLGDFCGDDHFFGYALPVGMAKSATGGDMTVTVDTICARWHVCVHDHRKVGPGIKSIQILEDPNGDIIRPPEQSYNVIFDVANPNVNPDNLTEIDLVGSDTAYCFDVLVANNLDSRGAFGAIYIADNAGNGYLVKLKYISQKLTRTFNPDYSNGRDSLVFPILFPGRDTCANIIYVSTAAATDPTLEIDSAYLKTPTDKYFAINRITPSLPVLLHGGDSLTIQICFHSRDTLVHSDTLVMKSSCFSAPTTLVGPGGTPIIFATDRDFGSVIIGDTKCDTVTVRNIGTLPFTLTNGFLQDSINFSFNPPLASPVVIAPGGYVRLMVCFHPKSVGSFSTTATWKTDVGAPYTDSLKRVSFFRGTGVKPSVHWNMRSLVIFADSTVKPTQGQRRVYLVNGTLIPVTIHLVDFFGGEATEFTLVGNELSYNPLADSVNLLRENATDSFWIDIGFNPNLSKPYPMKFADRHTDLIVGYFTDNTLTNSGFDTIHITGTFDIQFKNDVPVPAPTPETPVPDISAISAFIFDRSLYVNVPDEMTSGIHVELFDLLGRRVAEWHNLIANNHRIQVYLPVLPEGMYIVRAGSNAIVRSTRVIR
jgi:hypothetical protein